MAPHTFPILFAPASPLLSPLEILKLVGFAMGGALHLYLCWVLYRSYGLRRVERPLFGLGLSIGLWHLGNFAAAMYESLRVDFSGGIWWLKGADIVAYGALACLPPLLAHAHFRVWARLDAAAPVRWLRPLAALGYVPIGLLPWVWMRLASDPYRPPIEKLASLLLPFIVWFVVIFAECALIDWRLAARQEATRERRLFEVFGATLLGIGVLFLLVYLVGARHWGRFGQYLDLLARLSSVAPTAIVSYYIYRYRYLELVIRRSFVYAALAAVVMMVYIYGIRRFSLFLDARYHVRPEAIEALLILVLMLLAGPLRRLTEGYLHRLLTSEVGLYRELVAQVGDAAAADADLAHYIAFVETRLREALALGEVVLAPAEAAEGETAAALRLAQERGWKEIEDPPVLERLGALAAYPLWREGRVVGGLFVRGPAQLLTAEKREILLVLAGHLAVALENCRLLEEKVKLERALAERERMASLGQMAATVAHEVKNPLSAIKSIAQVMREDEQVAGEYGRDLDLIAGEVDRLSRSVSQLLSFSRPADGAAAVIPAETTLREIVESAVTIARRERGAAPVSIDLACDPRFAGDRAVALKEIVLNLVLNAVQAAGEAGAVRIEAARVDAATLCLRVIDDGPGIPPEIRARIFEPFFTTRQRGTGLGLAIVARRVRELGGRIVVESDGAGTKFEIVFDG